MANYLFPIETSARELDQKILMSVLSAKKKRMIFVGDQQIIRILSYFLKGGVFYGKHLFGKPMFSDTKYYHRLKRRNFKIVHLNEEGAVWPGNENEWENLLKQSERPSILAKDDFMAVWGNWQKEFNLSYEQTEANISVTGHPRFDLYSEKFREYFMTETNDLKKKYGDYILVNTAFSFANNGEGGVNFIFKPTISYDASNSQHREYRFTRFKSQMFSLASIVELVSKLSLKFPDKNIVLRPHPSENTEYYRAIFKCIENVHIVYEGAVTPWILACKLMIHNGCTTAIEATLSNKPVINFDVNKNRNFDIYLANICGVTYDNMDDVISYTEKIFSDTNDIKVSIPKIEKAINLFYNYASNSTYLLVDKVLDSAEDLVDKKDISKPSFLKLYGISFLFRIYLFCKYSYLTLKGHHKKYVDYKKRFEVFSKKDISRRVDIMSKILAVDVKLIYVNKYLFFIKQK